MQEVCDYLKRCETFYLATVDGDQPRVRAFGAAHIFEGKLYIITARAKAVSKQMDANPKIEICAIEGEVFSGGSWLRLEAVAVDDNRIEAKQSMLEAYPQLQNLYNANDDNTQVLYLKDATATISSFGGEPKVIKF